MHEGTRDGVNSRQRTPIDLLDPTMCVTRIKDRQTPDSDPINLTVTIVISRMAARAHKRTLHRIAPRVIGFINAYTRVYVWRCGHFGQIRPWCVLAATSVVAATNMPIKLLIDAQDLREKYSDGELSDRDCLLAAFRDLCKRR